VVTATGIPPRGPLTVPWWMMREIAGKVAGDSITPPAWAIRDDLAAIGLDGLWEVSAGHEDEAAWQPWAERATAAIASRDAALTQRVADHLIAHPGNRGNDWDNLLIEPVTMSIVEGHGANPVVLALFTRLHDDMALHVDGGASTTLIEIHDAMHEGAPEPFLKLAMDLGGALWEGDRVELVDGDLPETLAIAIEGLPLRRVVSHPLLDRHDITVVEWSAPNIIIRHDGEIRRVLDWTPNRSAT